MSWKYLTALRLSLHLIKLWPLDRIAAPQEMIRKLWRESCAAHTEAQDAGKEKPPGSPIPGGFFCLRRSNVAQSEFF
jgi:hypothetical protein